MNKTVYVFLVVVFLAIYSSLPVKASSKMGSDERNDLVVSDPYSLIAAVNDLRSSYGLPVYEPSGILMSVAQSHAEYMASSGSVTHYGADGSRPFQRSLAAGYPLAGDLSLGGFHAENIIAGVNMSVYEAVNAWMGDAPHQNTMLSPNLTQIGAGVVIVGDRIFYVIDAARPTGATSSVVVTQSSVVDGEGSGEPGTVSGVGPLIATTIMPSTPNTEGEIIHQVKGGETLWLIAITYGTKIDILRALNNLGADNDIYPGQTLVIQSGGSVTPEPRPTIAPTVEDLPPVALSTELLPPTLTPEESGQVIVTSPEADQSAVSSALPINTIVGVVIVIAALVLAGVLAASYRKV